MTSIQMHPLSPHVGVEATGIDLNHLDEQDIGLLRQAVAEHGVLFVRDQTLTPEQHIAFARRWGEIHLHPFMEGMPDHPEILEIVKRPTDKRNFGGSWHTDQMFSPAPAMGTILYAVEVPSVGGDTMFTNQYLAYESLPARLAQRLASLHARHVTLDGDRSAVHPVIRVHPETRRPALYVNRQFTREIIELPSHQSISLLDWLFNVAENGDFQVRYRWSANTVAIWDNRCTQHCVVGDYTEMRHAERIAVAEA